MNLDPELKYLSDLHYCCGKSPKSQVNFLFQMSLFGIPNLHYGHLELQYRFRFLEGLLHIQTYDRNFEFQIALLHQNPDCSSKPWTHP